MSKRLFREFLPHMVAVFIFLMVAALYCKPVFDDKVLYQEDVLQWQAISHNSFQYKETHGHFPLWTNGLFSGMPAYQIAMGAPGLDIRGYCYNILTLWLMKPVSFFFLACICFYFLTGVLRIDPYIGIIGGLAYAYATYNPIIVAAGHDTKMQSIALLPAFIGSLILIYERKYWMGIALTTLFTALLVSANHMQIVYYSVIIAVIMTLGYAVRWIRQKDYRHLLRSVAIALAGGLVGVLCNAVVIFTTYDVSKETTRGGSELADARSNYTSSGLSETAAFGYSMYRIEPLVMLVPNIFGGSTEQELPKEGSKAMAALQQMSPQLASQMEEGLRVYWGGINEIVSGPPYAGAIICFLALIGFFILDNKHKWWILAAGLLTIAMSWGGYFEAFNGWLLKFLPMYNKFRAPSMIMIIPIFLLCIMAVLALQKILTSSNRILLWKKYRRALFFTGAVFGVLVLCYMTFDYTSSADRQLLQQAGARGSQVMHQVRDFIDGLKEDRQNLFFSSIFRSFLFILAAALLIGLQVKKKTRPGLFLGVLGILAFADVMGTDIGYLNHDNYQEQKEYQQNFTATPADRQILQDKSYYRVFDLRDSVSSALSYGAMTSYFHRSVGGYHAAKLKIYEDLIDHQLYNYPWCAPVINMLNTKYIIRPTANGEDSVITNRDALGPAWFVSNLRYESTPQAVMDSLTRFQPKKEAILFDADRRLASASIDPHPDTAATIRLLKNDNDVIIYRSESRTRQFAVFSEIFYNRGWRACIDNFNREQPIIRTDYALRGMSIPAGRHIIYFVFQPQSYYLGRQIQWMANIILVLMMVGAVIVWLQEKNRLNFRTERLSSWYNGFFSATR